MLYRHLFKFCILLTLIFFICCENAIAQSIEEMQSLRLFYKEDELVVSATRNPKPLSQVAENITVISAEEIEAMNAHTVAEILSRVPGVFLLDYTRDFGSHSMISIHGSEQRHVQVMVDGVSWNLTSEGHAETNSIPVGIIDRIEIIKGPASSAWGSSLGGVINIITKSAGTAKRPTGTLKASFGERNTGDYNAQIAGLTNSVGYYLYAGHQKSDGLRSTRDFDSTQLFSKFSLPASENINLGLAMGYSEPKSKIVLSKNGYLFPTETKTFFITATCDASLSPDLDMSLSLRRFTQNNTLKYYLLGSGPPDENSAEFLYDNMPDEKSMGASAKLVWNKGIHSVVVGIDVERETLDQTFYYGQLMQFFGYPATYVSTSSRDKYAAYVNDTLVINGWSITPGIRYDYNNLTNSFFSPSLGVTYRLRSESLLRASVARGFTLPPPSWSSGGGLYLDPNPSLKPESIWSYQMGIESTLIPYLWLKSTIFYHDVDDEIISIVAGSGNGISINAGSSRRKGIELELQTLPVYNFSFVAGLAYIHVNSSQETQSVNQHSHKIGIKYDDKKYWRAQLLGNYVCWDIQDASLQPDYHDWIWDFLLSRKIFNDKQFATEIFLNAHNIFNGNQYIRMDFENPRRWIEAGIKITF